MPLSRIQRLIGARMLASKHGKPCFYLAARVDVTELMAMRHHLSKSLGVKITSNSFFIRALAVAAAHYPLMVGRLGEGPPSRNIAMGTPAPCGTAALGCDGKDTPGGGGAAEPGGPFQPMTHRQDADAALAIRIAEHVNVGFAVNSPQGLVVPVVRHAETRTLAEIAAQEKRLTNQARGNQLTLQDLEDPTIGLSNLGAFDIDTFLGIAPPPVSAILTAGKVAVTAVPSDGQVVVRKLVSLSLAVDHRIVDAAYAARFLQSLTQHLQNPQRLIAG